MVNPYIGAKGGKKGKGKGKGEGKRKREGEKGKAWGRGKGRKGRERGGEERGRERILCCQNSNYLAFQSFDVELPDECYSRNVHVH